MKALILGFTKFEMLLFQNVDSCNTIVDPQPFPMSLHGYRGTVKKNFSWLKISKTNEMLRLEMGEILTHFNPPPPLFTFVRINKYPQVDVIC